MSYFARGALVAALVLIITPAFADDWIAVKLRGSVSQYSDGQWSPIKRGDVIPDARVVRTSANGHVQFTRGGETIDLDANTQIQIFDRGGAKPFTTVKQAFGTVAIEAQVENVQHFAVQTPFLAAVVKGTKFVVASGRTGARVKVNRGHVQVEDAHDKSRVTISVGQTATVDTAKTGVIVLSGSGELPKVLSANGQPVDAGTSASSKHEGSGVNAGNGKGKDRSGDNNTGNRGNGNGSIGNNSGNGNGNSSGGDGNSGNSGNGNGNNGGEGKDKGKDKDK